MSSRREDKTPPERKDAKTPNEENAAPEEFAKDFFPDDFETDLFGSTPGQETNEPPTTKDVTCEGLEDAPDTDTSVGDSVPEENTPIVLLPDLLDLDPSTPDQVDVLLQTDDLPSARETESVVGDGLDRAFVEAEQTSTDSSDFDLGPEEDAEILSELGIEIDAEAGGELDPEPGIELDAEAAFDVDDAEGIEIDVETGTAIENAIEGLQTGPFQPIEQTTALDVGTGLSPIEEAMLDEEEQTEGASWTRAFVIVGAGVGGLLMLLFAIGWPYYRLSIGSRAFHHYHKVLRPSGTIGLTLGIVGTGLILLTLVYLMRKRFVKRETLVTLRAWMGFHVLSGLVGPGLILFHAAFVPYSALGMMSFYAMLIVVGTGLLGRYIYAHVPRSLEGRELELEAVRARLEEYRRRLLELGVSSSLLELESPGVDGPAPHFAKAFLRIFYGDRESRQEFKRLRATVRSSRELLIQAHQILPLMRRLCKERQWLVRYGELRQLMGAWRFLHRWLAVVMFVLIVFHIAIGVNFGELWIFGGQD